MKPGHSPEDTHEIDTRSVLRQPAQEPEDITLEQRRRVFAELVSELGSEVLKIDDID